MSARTRELRAQAPRNWGLRISILLLTLGGLGALMSARLDSVFSGRIGNMQRFGSELVPWSIVEQGWQPGAGLQWSWAQLLSGDAAALASTLALSVVAIVLAALLAGVLGPLASGRVMGARPWLEGTGLERGGWGWRGAGLLFRLVAALLRAVPEYLLAFLLLSLLGLGPWPAILALGLHNAGILARLGAERIDDTPLRLPQALRGAGLSRAQVVLLGLFPENAGRMLLYVFVRWESCVRQATVLGMLGILSLGQSIADNRARGHYDEVFFLVILGAGLIVVGDVVSVKLRRHLAQSS
ncbi:MAG: phosphonate transport system permease protein [Cognaticolwellia sp.]|jgi:phosphonate transport system permease protein